MLCRVDRGDQGLELRLECRVCQTRLYPGTIRLDRCMDSQIHFSSKSKDGDVCGESRHIHNFTARIPAEIVGKPTDTRSSTAALSGTNAGTSTHVAFQMSRAIDTNI
jgi:hypothetical protein